MRSEIEKEIKKIGKLEAVIDIEKYGEPPERYARERDLADDYAPECVMGMTGEFLAIMVTTDPNWIKKNATKERPVVVTTPANLEKIPMTSLSPYIVFRGIDWKNGREKAWCAKLSGTNIEVLEGTFHCTFSANNSRIKCINSQGLHIHRPKNITDLSLHSIDLSYCQIEVARGKFPYPVDFKRNPLKEIDTDPETGLHIEISDEYEIGLYVDWCKDLKILKGRYTCGINADSSGIETLAYDPSDPYNPTKNLIIDQTPNEFKISLEARWCDNLKTIAMLRSPCRVSLDGCKNLERIQEIKHPIPFDPSHHPMIDLHSTEKLSHLPEEYVKSQQIGITPAQRAIIIKRMAAAEMGRQMLRNAGKSETQEPLEI
jgi:hypothetical protein